MYSVSDNYKSAVYAPIRTAKARVTFDISDTSAMGDINTITATGQASISDKTQLVNKKREQSYNLATCEPDRVKLDGSFSFSDDTIVNNKEIGFCSDILCGNDMSFTTFPTLTFIFNGNHSSLGLTITFDVPNGEYATDFNIAAYDSSNAVITSVDVVGNTLVQCTPIGQLYNYRKIIIIIKKWCKGNRRARVCEVDFGVVRVYQDNNLIKMSLIEQLDLTTSTLPSAEFKFTVDNVAREFNILNPSGFYKYLQQRQQVIAEIGIATNSATTEYVQLGNYLLYDWISDEGSLTASFTAKTNLDIMSNYSYQNLINKTAYSLYQMAIDVFAVCGITNYQIDLALQSITTLGLVKSVDCKSILQMIAIAGCANIYVTRDNKIVIKVSPLSIGTVVDTIGMNNMYEEPQIVLDGIVMSVAINYFTDINTKIVVTANNSGVSSGSVLKLETNTLINTSTMATNIANWLLREKNYRAIYNINNWRGNPAHELNDILSIENSYGVNKSAIITRNELNYEGYLRGKTEVRGLSDVVG